MIEFKVDTTEFKRWIDRKAQKQVYFATANALTQTGVKSAESLKDQLGKKFNIKRKGLLRQYNPYPKRGMVVPANKKQSISRMYTEIGYPVRSNNGSLLPRMDWHIKGAIKRPKKHRNIAVPLTKKKITKSQRPSALLKKRNYYITKINNKSFIAKHSRNSFKPVYVLKKQARIKKRLEFNEVIVRTFSRHLRRNFIKSMKYAMRTAR